MVDVPDPPRNEEVQSDDSNEDETPNEASGIERSKSPVPAKIHHLFVKVPPKQTAKFERMVRRNRTLEHEVKVYQELLRDLQNFINERLPRNPIGKNIFFLKKMTKHTISDKYFYRRAQKFTHPITKALQ